MLIRRFHFEPWPRPAPAPTLANGESKTVRFCSSINFGCEAEVGPGLARRSRGGDAAAGWARVYYIYKTILSLILVMNNG